MRILPWKACSISRLGVAHSQSLLRLRYFGFDKQENDEKGLAVASLIPGRRSVTDIWRRIERDIEVVW